MIDEGEKEMFSVTIGNYGIVNINRLPETQDEYNQIINARKGKESLIIDKYIKVFDVRNGEWDNDLIPILGEDNKPTSVASAAKCRIKSITTIQNNSILED